jgi:hypothetical protein
MTRLEQQTFINDLMESFKRSMDADFMAGRIPEHWDGRQLRLYILRRVESDARWGITRGVEWAFKRDCLINNL